MRLWITTVAFLLTGLIVFAQKSVQVRELESLRKTIEKEIETTSGLLEQTKESAQKSLARLSLLTTQIEQRKLMIQVLTKEIVATDREMTAIQDEIVQLEKELGQKRDRYSKSLQMIQKHHNSQDKLLFIFSANGFAQSVRRVRYLKEYAAWQKQQASDIVNKQKNIKIKREELEKTKSEKQKLLATREDEYRKIEEEEITQRQEIKELDRRKTQLQNELALKKRRAETLNRQIKEKIAEDVAKAEAEARASRELAERTGIKTPEANKRQAERAGGYAMNREEKQLSDAFVENRGRFEPLNRRYTIVGKYGIQKISNYVQMENNGVDLQTTANAEAQSVFEGTVRAIYVDGPGFSIIIRHGNYLTVYGNLREVHVRKDQKVKAGQALGVIYTDKDNSNSTILHFELWKENEKQDPAPWIRL